MGDWAKDRLKDAQGLASGLVDKGGQLIDTGKDILGITADTATSVVKDGVPALKDFAEDPVGAVTAPIKESAAQAVSDAIQDQMQKAMWDFAQALVDGAQFLLRIIVDLMLQGTQPQVTGDFIYVMGGRIFFISLPLIVAFAAMRIIVSTLRAHALVGVRDALVGAAASVVGTVALVPVTALAVRVMDAVADGLVSATLSDAEGFVDGIVDACVMLGTMAGNLIEGSPVSGPVEPWQVPAGGILVAAVIIGLTGLILIAACIGVGLALIARNMLLYIVLVVGPICLSGLAWEPTRAWAGKWAGWMTALIFARLAIAIVFGLGVLAITQPGDISPTPANVLQYFSTAFAGVLMLVVAAFMPWACFALFGFLGENSLRELNAAGDGSVAHVKNVASSAVDAGQSATGRAKDLLSQDQGSGTVGPQGPPGGSGPAQATAGPAQAGTAGAGGGAAGGGIAGGAAGAETGAVAGAEAGLASTGVGLVAVAGIEAGKAVGEGVKAGADLVKDTALTGMQGLEGDQAPVGPPEGGPSSDGDAGYTMPPAGDVPAEGAPFSEPPADEPPVYDYGSPDPAPTFAPEDASDAQPGSDASAWLQSSDAGAGD